MIKSLTIKDEKGDLLYKISVNKKGEYDQIIRSDLSYLKIDVRNEKNQKVHMPK